MSDIELLKRRFEREKAARKEAEALLEKKSLEVFQANEQLRAFADQIQRQAEQTNAIVESAAEGIITYLADGTILSFNAAAARIFLLSNDQAVGGRVQDLFQSGDETDSILFGVRACDSLTECVLPDSTEEDANSHEPCESTGLRSNGRTFPCELSVSQLSREDHRLFTVLIRDVTRRKRLEARLSQAQKMESVGQLAAGIAHEINTPIQFVGNNIQFLEGAFDDLVELIGLYDQLYESLAGKDPDNPLVAKLTEQREIADLEFLQEECPSAIKQSREGIDSVATIVRAMKEFSQPANEAKSALDLNKAVQNVLAVSVNQYRDIAQIETNLQADLPPAICLGGQINQALLNVLGNASEAISEHGDAGHGRIWIDTSLKDDAIELKIQDNGVGIPQEIQDRIFDPFFTTKEVGKGSGQGLAFVYDVIVNKHEGSIHVASQPGEGSTFVLRLPLSQTSNELGRKHAGTTD